MHVLYKYTEAPELSSLLPKPRWEKAALWIPIKLAPAQESPNTTLIMTFLAKILCPKQSSAL